MESERMQRTDAAEDLGQRRELFSFDLSRALTPVWLGDALGAGSNESSISHEDWKGYRVL
jgi:hypothetical protein